MNESLKKLLRSLVEKVIENGVIDIDGDLVTDEDLLIVISKENVKILKEFIN